MISIITPVLNEEQNIAPFLKNLNQIQGDFELIMVDGGSSDKTIDEIKKYRIEFHRELKILKTSAGRGHQMNIGAKNARSDILFFLHVDSKIEKDTIPTIENEIKKKKIIGGGLTQCFSDSDNFLTLTSNFGNLRTRITNRGF